MWKLTTPMCLLQVSILTVRNIVTNGGSNTLRSSSAKLYFLRFWKSNKIEFQVKAVKTVLFSNSKHFEKEYQFVKLMQIEGGQINVV